MAVNSYREDEFMENTDKKKIMRRLFSYLLAYKGTIIAVLFCMGVTVAISLVNPLLIEEAIDHYIAQSDLQQLRINRSKIKETSKPDFYCDGKTPDVCDGGDFQQDFTENPSGSV